MKLLRQRHVLTPTDCAKQLRISTLYFSKIKSGSTDVNISRLQQIAGFFEVPLGSFFMTKSTVKDNVTALIKQLKDKLADIDSQIMSLQRRLILLYDLSKEKK
jgi:transcriptional regulator with XRE-family HTH domain